MWRAIVIVGAFVAAFVALAMEQADDRRQLLQSVASPTPSPSPAPRFPRDSVELPSGVPVIPERKGYVAREDVLAGALQVPSGQLAVDDFFYGPPQVALEVPAGRHPVRITLADVVGQGRRSRNVALATLVTAPTTPVRWREVGVMGTDGATGGFASAEAVARMTDDPTEALHNELLRVSSAHVLDGVGELPLGPGLNLFTFSSGASDGGFAVYAGTDLDGRIARVVFDAALLHLDWAR